MNHHKYHANNMAVTISTATSSWSTLKPKLCKQDRPWGSGAGVRMSHDPMMAPLGPLGVRIQESMSRAIN